MPRDGIRPLDGSAEWNQFTTVYADGYIRHRVTDERGIGEAAVLAPANHPRIGPVRWHIRQFHGPQGIDEFLGATRGLAVDPDKMNIVRKISNTALAAAETCGADATPLRDALLAAQGEYIRLQNLNAPVDDPAALAALRRHHQRLDRLRAQARFLATRWEAGQTGAIAVWPDANPWDAFDAYALPESISDDRLRIAAYQNESESVAFNLYNTTAEALDVRIQFTPPALTGAGRPEPDPAIARHVTLRRSIQVPGADGMVNDALPELDRSRTLTLPPGEVRQLWLVIDTDGLEAGTHEIPLYIGSIEQAPSVVEASVELEVWPLRLPDGGVPRMNWLSSALDQTSDQVLQDAIDHGMSVVYGPTPPAITLDVEGNLVEVGDWTEFDKTLARLPDYFQVYFHGPPTRNWPDGTEVEPDSELYRKGFATAVHAFVDHLNALGWGYDRWAFYPIDEPWNTGDTLIPHSARFART
jgi:hypothetical protein